MNPQAGSSDSGDTFSENAECGFNKENKVFCNKRKGDPEYVEFLQKSYSLFVQSQDHCHINSERCKYFANIGGRDFAWYQA